MKKSPLHYPIPASQTSQTQRIHTRTLAHKFCTNYKDVPFHCNAIVIFMAKKEREMISSGHFRANPPTHNFMIIINWLQYVRIGAHPIRVRASERASEKLRQSHQAAKTIHATNPTL